METIIELIKSVKQTINSHKEKLKSNETLTRYVLIDPILKHLGYSLSNPNEVIPEQKIEKKFSDYTIFKDNKPHIIIEAKSLHKPFEDKAQIGNYMANTVARYAMFSDGAKWSLFDFHIIPKDHQDERIILDIDILTEPENQIGIKLFCLTKENLFSNIPFFVNQKPLTDILKPQIRSNSIEIKETDNFPPSKPIVDGEIYEMTDQKKDIQAFGKYCKETGIKTPKFTVLKDSVISNKIAPAFERTREKDYKLLKQLEKDGIINDVRQFTEHYTFNSISQASTIINGSSSNGKQWKKSK